MKKIVLGLVLALLLSSNAHAECVQGNCENGQGTYTDEGGKYVGHWENGQEHGQGTLTYANGDKWVGKWKNGKRIIP